MAKSAEAFVGRYAKGLIDALAADAQDTSLDEALSQLQRVGSCMRGEVRDFFANPTFTHEEKQNVLNALLQELKTSPALVQFFGLVVSLGHMNLTADIARAFEEELHDRRKEVRGTLRSAYPLTEKELKRLSAALEKATGKKMLLEVKEDSELIGGVVAHVGSVVYDASIRGFLNRMQQEL